MKKYKYIKTLLFIIILGICIAGCGTKSVKQQGKTGIQGGKEEIIEDEMLVAVNVDSSSTVLQ